MVQISHRATMQPAYREATKGDIMTISSHPDHKLR